MANFSFFRPTQHVYAGLNIETVRVDGQTLLYVNHGDIPRDNRLGVRVAGKVRSFLYTNTGFAGYAELRERRTDHSIYTVVS